MRRVVWAEPALDDLDSIRTTIGQFNPVAPRRVAQRIISATNTVIALFPQAGRPIGGNRYAFPIFWPHAPRHRVEGEDVIILRVSHVARQAED